MRILCCSIAWLALFCGIGGCDGAFPSIEAENLLGRKVALPQAAAGQPTVFVIGFTHASQSQTKAWGARLGPGFAAYSVAVLEDVPRLVRGMAVGGIKSGVPQNRRDRFLLVFHGEKELKAAAGFDRPDDAYLVLLDRDGSVRWRFHGPFSESTLQELNAQFAELQK